MALTEFVETDPGIRLCCQQVGNGMRKILVPGKAYLWPGMAPLATSDSEVLLLDQRGRGHSTPIDDELQLGIDQEVADIEAVRRHFQFDQMALIGWSYLSLVVARYALEFPSRVKQIILLGPLFPRRTPYLKQHTRALQARRLPTDADQFAELVKGLNGGEDTPRNRAEAFKLMCRPQFADPNFEVSLADDFHTLDNERVDRVFGYQIPAVLKGMGDWDLREQLSEIAAPTLIVHGAFDPVPMDSAREWADAIPDSRLFEAQGSGHYPWLEEPDLVLNAMNSFLEA